MEYKLQVSRRADNDTIDALDYYSNINVTLSIKFLAELSDCYTQLKSNPQYYSLISSNPNDKFRDVKLKSFPYVVVFEINAAAVSIIAVISTHQKPISLK